MYDTLNFKEMNKKLNNLTFTDYFYRLSLIALSIFIAIKSFNKLNDKTKQNVEKIAKKAKKKKGKEQVKEEQVKELTTKVCPYCFSEINVHATRCPHCTSELKEEE